MLKLESLFSISFISSKLSFFPFIVIKPSSLLSKNGRRIEVAKLARINIAAKA